MSVNKIPRLPDPNRLRAVAITLISRCVLLHLLSWRKTIHKAEGHSPFLGNHWPDFVRRGRGKIFATRKAGCLASEGERVARARSCLRHENGNSSSNPTVPAHFLPNPSEDDKDRQPQNQECSCARRFFGALN